MQNRYKNNFKVHETEGYQLDRAVQQIISNVSEIFFFYMKSVKSGKTKVLITLENIGKDISMEHPF